jgi:hypothetical protein
MIQPPSPGKREADMQLSPGASRHPASDHGHDLYVIDADADTSLTTATCAKGERSNASSTRVQRAAAAARIKTSNVPTAILIPTSPLCLSKIGFLPYHPRQSIVDSPAWKIASECCNLNSTNTAPKARKLALPTLAPAPSQTEHGKQTNRPSNTTSLIS